MKIPVLLALPAHRLLRESARREVEGTARGILKGTKAPQGAVLDDDYSAVAIGSGVPGQPLEELQPHRSELFAVRAVVDVERPEDIPHTMDGADVLGDPIIASYSTCLLDPAHGNLADVGQSLGIAALHAAGLDGDGVAIAIMDSGINLQHLQTKLGWAPKFDAVNAWDPPGINVTAGTYPLAHGTMCAFDALIAAPKATLIDVPVLLGTPAGGSAYGARLSTALQGIAHLSAFWRVAFSPGGAGKYKALVVNASWGLYNPSWDFPVGHPGRYSDNPRHMFNQYVRLLAEANADILFAAGNCGGNCPDALCQGVVAGSITGANASDAVLTVAGCDLSGQRAGYSSQGPAIAGMAANKPDIAAYTHFSGSEALGSGVPDKGTSAACPVATGCIAALRTSLDPNVVPPASLFQQVRTTARQVGGTGWNGDYGFGIIEPLAVARHFGLIPSS